MSLQVTNQKCEREQIVALRRQSVFMFIATHLDADGCFSESDQYIANTVAGSDRKSVNRARKSLEETGDIMVVNEERRYDARGKLLSNRVRPVPVRTFWVREWVRQGSKTAETALDTSGRSVQGETEGLCPRLNPSNDEGLTQKTSAPVSKDKTLGRVHKNRVPLSEPLHSLSVGLQGIESCTHTSVQGEPSKKYIDSPVKRALARLRGDLEEAKGYLAKYDSAINRENVRRIEQQIADLEGRQ
ncbi:MAG: hypothetical protein ACM3WP_02105 [Acidobacteriota bacterium]